MYFFHIHFVLILTLLFVSCRCFLLLLLMAAILWKIKQKYDMFRRRQRLFVEMEQMAQRPFSQVIIKLYYIYFLLLKS